MSRIHNLMAELLPGSNLGRVMGTFERMGVAEEEIARVKLDKAQQSRAFAALCPSDPLLGKALDLYRAHAVEIVQRVRDGRDLRPATDAELLAVFSDTSLKAPPHATAIAAMEELFARCFPAKKLGGRKQGRELYKGAINETITQARRKFAVHNRGDLP